VNRSIHTQESRGRVTLAPPSPTGIRRVRIRHGLHAADCYLMPREGIDDYVLWGGAIHDSPTEVELSLYRHAQRIAEHPHPIGWQHQ
jgi:hypothetical protein